MTLIFLTIGLDIVPTDRAAAISERFYCYLSFKIVSSLPSLGFLDEQQNQGNRGEAQDASYYEEIVWSGGLPQVGAEDGGREVDEAGRVPKKPITFSLSYCARVRV